MFVSMVEVRLLLSHESQRGRLIQYDRSAGAAKIASSLGLSMTFCLKTVDDTYLDPSHACSSFQPAPLQPLPAF